MMAPSRVRAAHAALVLSLALVLGCGGGDSSGPSKDIDGHWRGSASTQGFNLFADITLTDASGHISGGGSLSGTVGCNIQISGTRTGDKVTLSMTCPGYAPISFSGHVSSAGNSIPGTVSGSGFTGADFDFIKQ